MLSHLYLNLAIWGPHPVGPDGFSRFFCPSEAEGDKKNGPEALPAMPMVHGKSMGIDQVHQPWKLVSSPREYLILNHENLPKSPELTMNWWEFIMNSGDYAAYLTNEFWLFWCLWK